MSGEIIQPKDFVISRLSYGAPKQQNNGGKTIYISYADKQLLMQTPVMTAPFGVSVWPSDNGGPDKYNLDVSFDGMDGKEPLRQFYAVLEAMDERVVNDAMENSQLWFKKRFPSKDVVLALYTATIKQHKDRETGEVTNQYAPKFKMSLPMRDGKFSFPVFDSKRASIDIFDVINSEGRGKGSRVQAIVMCSCVWIVGTKFGVTWKVRQLKLSEPAKLKGYAFVRTEDDDEEEDEVAADAQAAGSGAPKPAAAANCSLLESSDEEDGPDELDLPAAAAAAAAGGAKPRKPAAH
jgi:hypothetical protein